MKKLRFSTAKYEYLVANIDFLDMLLTEQIEEKKGEKINIHEFSEFLTTSIYNEKNEIDVELFKRQEEFKYELKILSQNIKSLESENDDKVIHFLNHLIGGLDLKSDEDIRIMITLLEYVEFHKTVSRKEKTK